MTELNVNHELGRAVARAIKARAKYCYRNAFRALGRLEGAVYVEGYVVSDNGLVIEHAWLEYQGAIVDPTMPEGMAVRYEPGLRFSEVELYHALMNVPKPEGTEEDLPIFYRYGWGGSDSPEMRGAWARGMEASRAIRAAGGAGNDAR